MHRNAHMVALAAMLAAEIAAFALVPPSSRLHRSRRRATEEEIAWMLDDDAWDEDDEEDDEAFDEQMRVRAAAEHESYAARATPLRTGDRRRRRGANARRGPRRGLPCRTRRCAKHCEAASSSGATPAPGSRQCSASDATAARRRALT